MNVMRQTVCLVVNPITIDIFSALFKCTPTGRPKSFHFSWLGLDALSLVGPTGVQLLDFCCSSVSVLVLLLSSHLASSRCWILICVFVVLMQWWVKVLHADRITFNLCLWTTAKPRARVVATSNWFKPPSSSNLLPTVPRRCFCCSLF